MTKEAADAKALQIITDLGVPNWHEYRHWNGRYILPNDFDSKRREWSYVWHRHIGDIPIWNESVILHLEDESGELISLNNSSTSLDRQPPKTARLTHVEAKELVVRVWTPYLQKREGSSTPYKLEARTSQLVYRHIDFSRDEEGRQVDPQARVELRLVYVIGVKYGAISKDGGGFAAYRTALVDAETGVVMAERSFR